MRLKHFAALAILAISSLVALPAYAQAAPLTKEVLVLTTATEVTTNVTLGRRVAIEIQNLGPEPIFCGFTSATTVVNKARVIEAKVADTPADSWSIDAKNHVRIWCITSVNQVTTAATAVSELLE